MANNLWYYYYSNPDAYIKQILTKEGISFDDIIWWQDIINTRLSMFRYPNLERRNLLGGLKSKDLEYALLLQVNLCFADVPAMGGWLTAIYTAQGSLDFNRHPTAVKLTALNGADIPGTYPYSSIIPIYDNNLGIPRIASLLSYIRKIKKMDEDVLKLCDVACLPAIITGDKKQAAALKEVANKLNIRDPFIVGDSALVGQVQTFDIKLAISPIDIYDLKIKYKNECLASMGIYNAEQKRERLITQELVNQNDYSDFTYNSGVLPRKEAVRLLKEVSGIDIGFEETYDYNYRENTDIEAEKTQAMAKAEAKGEKEGNPDAGKGGFDNAR